MEIRNKLLLGGFVLIVLTAIAGGIWIKSHYLSEEFVEEKEKVIMYSEFDNPNRDDNVSYEFTNGNFRVEIRDSRTIESGLSLINWEETEFKIDLPTTSNDFRDNPRTGGNIINNTFGNTRQQMYMVNNNTFEWEIILDERPESNYFLFNISLDNLTCYKQPPMNIIYPNRNSNETHGFDRNGKLIAVYDSENIVNSFACYHNSSKNNEYMTGKAFHIYRIKVIDRSGHWVWGDMEIVQRQSSEFGNNENYYLNITIPESFIGEAVYPITIDPTVGYTTCGATGTVSGDEIHYSNITMTESGTLTHMSSCAYSYTSPKVYHAIYSNTTAGPTTLIEKETTGYTSAGWATGNWHTVSMAGTTSLTSGTKYWLAVVANETTGVPGSFRYNADYVTYRWGGTAYEAGEAFPNTATPSFTNEDADYRYSVYANYTTGGAPPAQCWSKSGKTLYIPAGCTYYNGSDYI